MFNLVPQPVPAQSVFVLLGQCAAINLVVFADAVGTYRIVIQPILLKKHQILWCI